MSVYVETYATDGPGDARGLSAILAKLPLEQVHQLALLGKTEGTATINDFSRELALRGAEDALRAAGGEALLNKTTLIFSTGCEGVLSPGVTVLASLTDKSTTSANARLAMGQARTRPLKAEELSTPTHIHVVADSVRHAMSDAGLTADQVTLVFIKSPILTHKAAAATGDPNVIARAGSSGRSRGAAALGVALALGEIDAATADTVQVYKDFDIHAKRAMTFSGTEVDHNEILVLGNKPGAGGNSMIFSTMLADILDARAIKRMCREAGCGLDGDGELTGVADMRAVFLKAGVAPDGLVRGERTTVYQSEVDPDKHMRGAASGLIGGLLGTTRIFVSGGAEHQAPPGGGICACIADVDAKA